VNAVKLTDLDGQFLKIDDHKSYHVVESIDEAQGVMFLCPKCFAANRGKVGTHSVLCWFAGRGVPDDMSPKPGRWNPSGTGIYDLTFVPPGAVSVLLLGGGCGWHGFVTNGDAS
jgi:hypothetical protein